LAVGLHVAVKVKYSGVQQGYVLSIGGWLSDRGSFGFRRGPQRHPGATGCAVMVLDREWGTDTERWAPAVAEPRQIVETWAAWLTTQEVRRAQEADENVQREALERQLAERQGAIPGLSGQRFRQPWKGVVSDLGILTATFSLAEIEAIVATTREQAVTGTVD
jgi:hypothetical protein